MKAHASIGNVGGGLAGGIGNLSESGVGYPHVLIAFVYDLAGTFFEEKLRYWPQSCLGDSGAFTVWTKGETVDLDAYIEWCRAYVAKRPDFQCVSLDVIPGKPGQEPTAAERQRAMDESLDNGDRLRDAGLRIIEVYHQFEPSSHLDRLLERLRPGETLGIAPRNDASANLRRSFGDGVFGYLRSSYGTSLPRTHGFAVNPLSPLAARYPWYSVDASTWMTSAQYGRRVSRGGKLIGNDTRNSNRNVRAYYLGVSLQAWLRRQDELTRLWEQRGITFTDPEPVVASPP